MSTSAFSGEAARRGPIATKDGCVPQSAPGGLGMLALSVWSAEYAVKLAANRWFSQSCAAGAGGAPLPPAGSMRPSVLAHQERVRALAEYSNAAYELPCAAQPRIAVEGGEVSILPYNSGFVVKSEQEGSSTCLLCFRGTFSVADVVMDASASQVPVPTPGAPPRSAVHSGFAAAYNSVQEDVMAHAKGADFVVLTGHSAGAALAVMAALDIAATRDENSRNNVSAVVFAPPKVGNFEFGAWCSDVLGDRLNLVINQADVAPLCPPGAEETPYVQSAETADTFLHDGGDWITNHSMDTYIQAARCGEFRRRRVRETLQDFAAARRC